MDKETFRALRLSKNMTQKEFGELLGVSESTVAAIENGRRLISDKVRARLATITDIDDDFIDFYNRFRIMGTLTHDNVNKKLG